MRRRKHDDTEIALANFSLTFAKALLVFCVILFLMINPNQKKEDGIKPKIEYMITMSWPTDLDYDVDIWIKDPDGKVLYYENKEVGFMTLERDDLGKTNNTVMVQGQEISILNNEELVSVRGFNPGEYVINAHLYSALRITTPQVIKPFNVTITIQKMNPTVTIVYQGVAVIDTVRQEVHIVRFTMESDGTMKGFTSDLPVNLRETTTGDSGGILHPGVGQ
jgi:hypothetical protein